MTNKSSFVVLNGTNHKTGEPIVNKCKGCQNNNEKEEHEEEPLMLTGWGKPKQKTDKEEDDKEEKPLLSNYKY
jgi:hypothetical protein